MSILHKIFAKEHLLVFLNWISDVFVEFFCDFIWAFFGAILLAVLSGPKIQTYLIDNVLSPGIVVFMLTLFILWAFVQITGVALSKILNRKRNGSDAILATTQPKA